MGTKLFASISPASLSIGDVFVLTGGLLLAYVVSSIVYQLYLSPLAKAPGPKIWALSNAASAWAMTTGRYPYIIKSLHDKYGPIVRTGPNTVSFNSPNSWREIYGHSATRKPFLKTDFYNIGPHDNVFTLRDPAEHARVRKLLSNAFSTKALSEQEDVIQEYVDLFVKQIGTHAVIEEGAEMVSWYNWFTFDVIGDLAFGDPFGCLKAGSPHFWVSLIEKSVKAGAIQNAMKRVWGLRNIRWWLVPKTMMEARKKHMGYSFEKVVKRMDANVTRKDFWTKILADKEASGLSVGQLAANAHILIVAGSETTATFLSGVTYHLCRNPRVYSKLASEIRSAFNSYDSINGHSTEKLSYLKAVIDEGLRIFPPVPIGMPRISPGEVVEGIYIPEGMECFTTAWAATHSEENFHSPYEFKPDRWIDPTCQDRKDASQPFLLGSRVCIGRSLALLEIRLIMCKMLWTYDMQLLDEKLDWDQQNKGYMLWEKPKLRIKYTKRPGIEVPVLND